MPIQRITVTSDLASIDLAEYGRVVASNLTDTQARDLNQSKALTVTPSATGGWELKAAQYIGVVQAGNVEVRIRPKVPTKRLLFLLAYAMRPEGWQELMTLLGEAEDPIEGIAHAFCHHSEAALAQGLLQGYVTVEEALPGLRGRLREGDQLRRRFGLMVPLEVTFDDFTPDIAENKLLKSAAHRLLMSQTVLPGTRRRLRRLRRKLANVTRLVAGESIPTVRTDRRNGRYENAVVLATLILQSMTIEVGDRARAATGFLFDMNKAFEDFVTRALMSAFRGDALSLDPQRISYLDVDETVKLKPDISWVQHGVTRAVADLKYKSLEVKELPNADVYQMLAYSMALGLKSGHLVSAAGNEEPSVKRVRHAGIEIVTWTLPLDLEPQDLLDAVRALGHNIVEWEPKTLATAV